MWEVSEDTNRHILETRHWDDVAETYAGSN